MAVGASLKELENRIGYNFVKRELLNQAVTHSSYANERKIRKSEDYERLEFLGDAVLELITSEYLFCANKEMPEGKLTRLRASIVCEPALAECAKKIELGRFMLLGKGEESTGGRERESIIADVMEALIGALYLDGGFEAAKTFVNRYILCDVEDRISFHDSKTILQEMIQTVPNQTLSYELIEETGPDHNKEFSVYALLNGDRVGFGRGKTKKAAEQHAAYEAIGLLKGRMVDGEGKCDRNGLE